VTNLRAGGPCVGFFDRHKCSSDVLIASGAIKAPFSLDVEDICTGVKADGDEADHRC